MKSIIKLFGIIAFITVSGGYAQGQAKTIPGLPSRPITVTNNARIQEFNGSFTAADQKVEYTFTPPVDGQYRFEISNLASARINMVIKNSTGSVVGSVGGIGNGSGLTINGIKGGETYTIQIGQYDGLGLYRLSIGYQKPTVDITGFTEINDSIQFTHQYNYYTWTAPIGGRYRFQISNLASAHIRIVIINSFGMIIGESSPYGIGNGDGLTMDGIKGGETYTIQIRQYSGLSLYRLSIGYQKPTVDVTGFTEINDSIQFTHQYNYYTWTAPAEGGRYRFEISNLAGANIRIVIINSFGMVIGESSPYGIGNGDGLTMNGIRGGETYTIQIRQHSGLSLYRLSINR
jgi:hypothetical protein